MVDTGSDISLCKINVVERAQKYFNNKVINLSGIGDGMRSTLGEIDAKLKFNSSVGLTHNLFLVDEEFPVKTDGIIGRDFLDKYNCNLDYGSWIISFIYNQHKVEVPMFKFISVAENEGVTLPAHTEVIQAVNLVLAEDSVIHSGEIAPGVFLADSIVPASGVKHVKILNKTDQQISLQNFPLRYEPLSNFCEAQHFTDTVSAEREQRVDALVKSNMSAVPKNDAESIAALCTEFHDIFHLPNDKLTVNNFYKQRVILDDKNPVYKKNYRLPESQKPEIRRHVEKLIKDDVIEPSVSPYNSPILLVPKKGDNGEKTTRLVIDFRSLNERVCADKFPLPRIDSILDQLGRARVFSTLDISSAFYQISLEKASRPCTAFSVSEFGHFQFKRLPFGIKIAPNSFSRMMSIALSGLEDICFWYIDDLIIHACSVRHHLKNLRRVFERLRQYNLKLNPGKCNFLKKELFYLGHRITDKGVFPDNRKFHVIENYPVPKNAKEVQRFVAFANYYRKFIPLFAEKAYPLNQLLRKKVQFEWTDERQRAFDDLRKCLMTPPVLKYPDYSQPFILSTDSSNYALGAVLSQGEIGSERPVAYASRSLNRHELKKPIIEKELLAIHWAIKYFRPILFGRKFIVITDHRPLVSLFTQRDPSSKMTRVRLDLEEYDFEVRFKPGKANVNADALSRIVIDSDQLKALIPREVDVAVVTRSQTKNSYRDNNSNNASRKVSCDNAEPDQLKAWNATSLTDVRYLKTLRFNVVNNKDSCRETDEFKIDLEGSDYILTLRVSGDAMPSLGPALEALSRQFENLKLRLSTEDRLFDYLSLSEFKDKVNQLQIDLQIIIYTPARTVSDATEQNEIVKKFHNEIVGHFGINKTLAKIRQHYEWPKMVKTISNFIKLCKKCQLNKVSRHNKEYFVKTDTPSTSFEVIEIDTVGPLPLTEAGSRYVVTSQCALTKFIDCVPVSDKSAQTVARAIVEQFFCRYGIAATIRTDLGTEYMNDVMREICNYLNITHKSSTPAHHETIGALERSHRVFNEFLRAHIDAQHSTWDKWLSFYTFSYNSTPHVSTKYTPYELVFGKLPNIPNLFSSPTFSYSDHENFAKDLKFRLQNSHKTVQASLNKLKEHQNETHNKNLKPHLFTEGSFVKLRVENRHKLDPVYSGPHEVLKTDGVNTIIRFKNKTLTVHNNRLLPFRSPIANF